MSACSTLCHCTAVVSTAGNGCTPACPQALLCYKLDVMSDSNSGLPGAKPAAVAAAAARPKYPALMLTGRVPSRATLPYLHFGFYVYNVLRGPNYYFIVASPWRRWPASSSRQQIENIKSYPTYCLRSCLNLWLLCYKCFSPAVLGSYNYLPVFFCYHSDHLDAKPEVQVRYV